MTRNAAASLLLLLVAVSAAAPAFAFTKFGTPPPPPPPPLVFDPHVPTPVGFSISENLGATGPSGGASVRVAWFNSGYARTATVFRATNGGQFTAVRTLSGLSGMLTTVDVDAPRDALDCFFARVTGDTGATAETGVECTFTRDGLQRSLFRAQLRVKTSTVSDAGTNASIAAYLNVPVGTTGMKPQGNVTFIDSPDDDFEEGDNNTYDLMLGSLADVSDVHNIILRSDGGNDNDALCVKEVELFLNGRRAFFSDFGNTTCRWVDQQRPLTIANDVLRASPLWAAMGSVPRPQTMSYEWLDNTITAVIGHSIHRQPLTFSSMGVPENTSASHRIYHYGFIAETVVPLDVQLDFTTQTQCVNGHGIGTFALDSWDVDADGWLWLIKPVAEAIVEIFEPSAPSFATNFDLGACGSDGLPLLKVCFKEDGLGPSLPNACQ